MKTETLLRNHILENYLFTEDQNALKNDVSFLDSGILDSMGMLNMIMFLQETFGIKVEDDEMVPENLDSINRLAAYVARKQAS